MFKLWFDETILPSCVPLLDGVAKAVGPAKPPNPPVGLEECQAIIASGNVIYDSARMDMAPKLQVIARLGAGIDNIVVADATARNIVVVYAPDAPTVSTAEHTLALMLAVAKKLCETSMATRSGNWRAYWSLNNKGMELDGRRLGLVGLGRIGSRMAKVASAMRMIVSAYDPFVPPSRAAELSIELAPTLEALLREADVVSLHVPATPETRDLMNAERFAQMKPGAIFINAARGVLVDEQALVAALQSGHLSGAGLDVFQQEPIEPNHPLLKLDNVVVTPHIASRTWAGHHRIWETTIVQALQVLRGERPPHMVNPEIWERRQT